MRTYDIVRAVAIASAIAVASTAQSPRSVLPVIAIEPIIDFEPTGPVDITPDTPQDPQTGWNLSDTGLAWNDSSLWRTDLHGAYPCHLPRDRPLRTSTYKGATVSLDWVGQEVYFWGRLTGNTTFTIDGQEMSLASEADQSRYIPSNWTVGWGTVLAFATGLQQVKHTATLTLVEGSMTISGATFILQRSLSNESLPLKYVSYELLDGNNNFAHNLFNNSGDGWEAKSDSMCDITSHCVASRRMSTKVQGAFITTRTPPNATSVSLLGTTGLNHGGYYVMVTPDLPFGANSYFRSSSMSPILFDTAVLWFAALDPTVVYEIKVTNEDQDSYLELNMFYFVQNNVADDANVTTTSPSSSSTAVVHVGGVVGVIILALALWFCMCRKGKKRRTPLNEDKFEVEERQDIPTPVSYVETKSPGATHLADTAPSVAPDDAPLDMNAMHPPSKALEAAAAVPAREAPHPQRPTAAATYPPSSTSNSPTTPWPQSVNRPETVPESLASPQDVGFSYERDAGRLRPMVNVPPSYDPRWADEPDEPESA